MPEFPLTVQSYQSRSLPFSAQRLLNMYAEPGTGGSKSPVLLIGTPGLKTFTSVGIGPIRGLDVVDNVLHAVSGNDVYSIDSLGQEILLGSLPGGGISPVSLANNGSQLCIVSDGSGFIVESGILSAITDPDFPGASSVTYIDGFFIFNNSTTIFNSALQDGTSFNALDTAQAEYDPDTVIAVFADHSDLLVFGQNTIEPYYNAALATGFPFLPRKGSAREVGLLARDSVKKLDNMVYFLGSSKRGERVVFRLNGYVPERVSTHAIEKRLDEFGPISTAIALTYGQEGHAFYCLKLPDDITLCFDVASGKWHERQSFGQNDWRVSHYAAAYNQRFVGDANTGNIFTLDLDTYLDNDADTIQRIITCVPVASDNGQWITHNKVRVDIDAGVGFGEGQAKDPEIFLRWSDEDGQTFSNFRGRKIGKVGERQNRSFWNRLGKSRSRIYQTAIYDPVPVHIKGAYIDVRQNAW